MHLIYACTLSPFSYVQLFATLWTVAHQAPLFMGFSRQEYWSGLPGPSPWDLTNPGIEPASLMSPALAGRFFTTSTIWEAHLIWSEYLEYPWRCLYWPWSLSSPNNNYPSIHFYIFSFKHISHKNAYCIPKDKMSTAEREKIQFLFSRSINVFTDLLST